MHHTRPHDNAVQIRLRRLGTLEVEQLHVNFTDCATFTEQGFCGHLPHVSNCSTVKEILHFILGGGPPHKGVLTANWLQCEYLLVFTSDITLLSAAASEYIVGINWFTSRVSQAS